MKRTVLIEGILFLLVGFVSMGEGLRLTIYKDPRVLYDLLGPGLYLFLLGFIMTATGVVHLFIHYRKERKDLSMEKVAVNKELRIRMISMIVVLAIYIILIRIVGYLFATAFFFFLEFRIVGFKSWPINIILSLILTAAYYIVFVQYCRVVFPRGVFFR
ncbi:MAG: tripartite tricarboxylate transporter TctB family protein [Candidatus Hodarchaeota archaeon]